MKVLFAVPYVPSRVRVRPYHLIRNLAAQGHDVTLVTVWTTPHELEQLDDLRQICRHVEAVHHPAWMSLVQCLCGIPTREPLQARYSWSSGLGRRLSTLAGDADVVHVEHLRGSRYAIKALSAGTIPVVWDSVDCISGLFRQALEHRSDVIGRLVTRLELPRTQRYESWLTSQFDQIIVSSPVDRNMLLSLTEASDLSAAAAKTSPVTVLPNGVDLDYFRTGSADRDPDSVVFTGKMSYHANESAAFHLLTNVMPKVWAHRPSTHVTIAGKDPSTRLRNLAAGHSQRVTVTGTVQDMRPYLSTAAIAVVPLVYGAGCQNKVLEAMASSTPVVTTPTAVSSLAIRPGRDVIVADTSDQFARNVVELLNHPSERSALGTAGRAFVEAHHRWDRVAARLGNIYERAIDARHEAHFERSAISRVPRLEAAPHIHTVAGSRDCDAQSIDV